MRHARFLVLTALGGVGAEAALIHLGRTYGSTGGERTMRLPGDDVIAAPKAQTDHAVTIDAPPAAVWPWLLQMGCGRAGWYTARWVDRMLFPANGPSAERVIPELQHLEVGSFIPDGPPETECGLHVVRIEPERCLVLRSNSFHRPRLAGHRPRRLRHVPGHAARRTGAGGGAAARGPRTGLNRRAWSCVPPGDDGPA